MLRALKFLFFALLLGSWPAWVGAQPEVAGEGDDHGEDGGAGESGSLCFEDFAEAQVKRRQGELRASREALRRCAADRCPAAIVEKCVGWLGELERDIPSVVIAAVGTDGKDTAEVSVRIDGELYRERLDGRAIELDPGTHRLELTHRGQRRHLEVLLAAGEKNRPVRMSFEARVATPPPEPVEERPPPLPVPPPAPPSPLLYAGAALAGAGVLAGAVTGGLALARADELEEACPDHTCNSDRQADYDEGVRLAHAATGCFVVAGVGAALAVAGIVLSTSSDPAASRAEQTSLRLRAGPRTLVLEGSF